MLCVCMNEWWVFLYPESIHTLCIIGLEKKEPLMLGWGVLNCASVTLLHLHRDTKPSFAHRFAKRSIKVKFNTKRHIPDVQGYQSYENIKLVLKCILMVLRYIMDVHVCGKTDACMCVEMINIKYWCLMQ